MNSTKSNFSSEQLLQHALKNHEGILSTEGALVVETGDHTARAALDKFFVKEPSSEIFIHWNTTTHQALSETDFDLLFNDMKTHPSCSDLYQQDCYIGASKEHEMPLRIFTEFAWHSLFICNLFLPTTAPHDESLLEKEGFTIVCAPTFFASPLKHHTRSGTFIVIHFGKRLCLIGGTAYSGEIKKAAFTLLNYYLPLKNVLPMHCSANVSLDHKTTLFFGLSGTGKTTLSTEPHRKLIGDDEHGWSDHDVFNFENGCYAKVLNLSAEDEPEIDECTRRRGTILENVVIDKITLKIDLSDNRLSENTRAAYPLSFIKNSVAEKKAGIPNHVIFLTCDAHGIMPPLAKLTEKQALYHFISGYTAKISGTEIGNKEPQSTFSTCYGAPFMVHHPSVYAKLLQERLQASGAQCWLLNTGWSGGPYGIGKRMSIHHSRALLSAALDGKLDSIATRPHPIFKFEIPTSCPGVPSELLNPVNTWADKKSYEIKSQELAQEFRANFKKYFNSECDALTEAGP